MIAGAAGAYARVVAQVDLGAIRDNIRSVLQRLSPGVKLMVVVKADAYGHGALSVARVAMDSGAFLLGVATIGEGLELRRAGIGAPVLVFAGTPSNHLPLAVTHRLCVTAYSLSSARAIAAYPSLKAHLKVNTGMNRWGVSVGEVGEASKILGSQLSGVYTHFASADSDRQATEEQIRTFEAVLAARPFSDALAHASNSAGTLWQPEARYSCVRIGGAAYGLHPLGDAGDPGAEGLRSAMQIVSYVADVRRLSPGEGVSYGLTFRAREPTYAATVPIGYADGYPRTLSGKASALIRGKRRPLLGRVTMDASVFGADGEVKVGDEVVLVGEQEGEVLGAEEVARWAGTINYEVTTGINPRRVERVHTL